MLVGGEEREAGEAAGQRRERVERERGVLLKKKEETKERGLLPCFKKISPSNDRSFATRGVSPN